MRYLESQRVKTPDRLNNSKHRLKVVELHRLKLRAVLGIHGRTVKLNGLLNTHYIIYQVNRLYFFFFIYRLIVVIKIDVPCMFSGGGRNG